MKRRLGFGRDERGFQRSVEGNTRIKGLLVVLDFLVQRDQGLIEKKNKRCFVFLLFLFFTIIFENSIFSPMPEKENYTRVERGNDTLKH